MTSRQATREAFAAVPETCPAVDEALFLAGSRIKEQTEALRNALIEALERAIEAEEKCSELEREVADLEQRVAQLEQP
jgi:hypothetical protein